MSKLKLQVVSIDIGEETVKEYIIYRLGEYRKPLCVEDKYTLRELIGDMVECEDLREIMQAHLKSKL